MSEPCGRPTRIEIDLDALTHNAAQLRGDLPRGSSLMAVVKADAYGHGAVAVARALYGVGIRHFAVATAEEGVALRRAALGGEILVLGYTDPAAARTLFLYRLTQAVIGADHAAALDAAGYPIMVHLKVDTGMHRVGIPPDDDEALTRVLACRNLRLRGVFTHLCVADELTVPAVAFTEQQLDRFEAVVARLRERSPAAELAVHARNSAGILNHRPRRDEVLVRSGIALYGVGSAASLRHPDLRPVLSLRSAVVLTRDIEPGETVGYGRTFRAARPTRVAVVPIGYADGLPRLYAERGGEVLIRGRRCPIIGRICMDQLTVDVTDLDDISLGDTVTFIGRDGADRITADEVAEKCGTIPYEILGRLGTRPARVYCGK